MRRLLAFLCLLPAAAMGATNLFDYVKTSGVISKTAGDTNKYARGDGTWQTVTSGGSGVQTNDSYTVLTGYPYLTTSQASGLYYPLSSNPSNYLTSVDWSANPSNAVLLAISTWASTTGSYYLASNPAGYITGITPALVAGAAGVTNGGYTIISGTTTSQVANGGSVTIAPSAAAAVTFSNDLATGVLLRSNSTGWVVENVPDFLSIMPTQDISGVSEYFTNTTLSTAWLPANQANGFVFVSTNNTGLVMQTNATASALAQMTAWLKPVTNTNMTLRAFFQAPSWQNAQTALGPLWGIGISEGTNTTSRYAASMLLASSGLTAGCMTGTLASGYVRISGSGGQLQTDLYTGWIVLELRYTAATTNVTVLCDIVPVGVPWTRSRPAFIAAGYTMPWVPTHAGVFVEQQLSLLPPLRLPVRAIQCEN